MAEIVDFGLQQHKIKMDSRYFENVLSVVAGDTGRRIEVQLLDTNGTVQNTTGLKLRLNAEIAGKATYTDATLVDGATGKYQLDLSNGMFLAPGNWQFQWQITDSAGKKLHSFAFTGNVGKNISEGGTQATNFYLNLEDLKAMQDDFVNGTIDSAILQTGITTKLTALEEGYAPKLTEVTAQLAQTPTRDTVWSLANMGQDVKTAMTGGSVAVVGPNAVLTDNIVNKAVTKEKLAFIPVEGKKSDNLFTVEMEPGSISWGGANENQYTDVLRTKGFIPVFGGQSIAWKIFNGKPSDLQHFYQYDESYIFIKLETVYGTDSSFILAENARFIRFRNGPTAGYVSPTPQFYKENLVIQYGTSVPRYISPNGKVVYSDVILPDRIDKSITAFTDIIFYGGTIRKATVGSNLVLTLSQEDKRLMWRFNGVETIVPLTQFEYTIPHNYSLVINRNTNALETIPSNDLVAGSHALLVRNHNGVPKNTNIRIENAYEISTGALDTNVSIRTKYSPRRPIRKNKFTFAIDQDGTIVGDEIWLFTGNPSDHSGDANIYRVNKETWEEIGIIKHNLGHANAVDYLNDKLLVFNGGGYPPEINIYTNPVGKEQLNYTDTNNFQLIFKEGTKSLPGDGSACFGESEQIIYYFDNTKIHKILLGMGDNDLSDKTVEKTDVTRFGVYQTGKTNTEYNGTAQVLKVYEGILNQQAQGMCYDGFLYLSTGFEFNHAFKVLLKDDTGTYEVVDDYRFNHVDYKGDRINIEAEVVFKDEGKVYVGARSATDSFLVSFEA